MFSMLYIDVMNVFNVIYWCYECFQCLIGVINSQRWHQIYWYHEVLYPFINCQCFACELKYNWSLLLINFTLSARCWTPSFSKSALKLFLRKLVWIRWDFFDTGSRLYISGTKPTNPFSLASWSPQDTHYTMPLSFWELNPEDTDLTMFKIQNLTSHARSASSRGEVM